MLRTTTWLTAFLLTSATYAEVIDISAIINASQELPAPSGVASSAAGFAHLQFDDATKELSWDIAWQDLTGPATGMHFHAAAAPGDTAGVALNIGGVSGLTSPSSGSMVIDDAFTADLLNGLSYINIHTMYLKSSLLHQDRRTRSDSSTRA